MLFAGVGDFDLGFFGADPGHSGDAQLSFVRPVLTNKVPVRFLPFLDTGFDLLRNPSSLV